MNDLRAYKPQYYINELIKRIEIIINILIYTKIYDATCNSRITRKMQQD